MQTFENFLLQKCSTEFLHTAHKQTLYNFLSMTNELLNLEPSAMLKAELSAPFWKIKSSTIVGATVSDFGLLWDLLAEIDFLV